VSVFSSYSPALDGDRNDLAEGAAVRIHLIVFRWIANAKAEQFTVIGRHRFVSPMCQSAGPAEAITFVCYAYYLPPA